MHKPILRKRSTLVRHVNIQQKRNNMTVKIIKSLILEPKTVLEGDIRAYNSLQIN